LAVVTGILAVCCVAIEFAFAESIITNIFANLECPLAISALLLLPSALVGRIATRGGSKRDGDIAMAIFASFCIGQFRPLFF
jgi:hypothetical protein